VKYNPLLATTNHKKANHKGILHAVDVQSNGALVFCAPSHFPTGKYPGGYTVVNDSPLIDTPDDLLIQVLESLEPEKEVPSVSPFNPVSIPENGRPGDIFNALTRWDDVLLPLGWTKVGSGKSGTQFWRRPGKKEGISASTNWKNYDLFFAYTTSVTGLSKLKGYTRFNLFATLRYGGDYRAAAKALVVENYKTAYGLV
jgi:putative DNA primase/helicase